MDIHKLENFIENRELELNEWKLMLEVARRVLPEHLKVELIREQHDRLEEQIKDKDRLLAQSNEKIRAAQRQLKELDQQVGDKSRELKKIRAEVDAFRESIRNVSA